MTAALENFPLPSTRFIGRTNELETLAQKIRHAQIVTLVGTGGCGKTRLALEGAAYAAAQFSDGAYFIDLAPLNDAAFLSATVAAALGVRDQAEQSLRETILLTLAEKNLLLVFDNCEHLLGACAEFVAALGAACPRVTVLATSRAALEIPNEIVFALAPLETRDAMELFADRAHHALMAFQRDAQNENAIAEICARLDNLPLAVELAAARVKMLAPAQIAARLDARFQLLKNQNAAAPTRQSTLRALLDWSDELLSDAERALFYTLGVFAGSFDLEAVEGVTTNDERRTTEPIDVLTGLAEKSLLVIEPSANETRYRLLETLREYAREKLRAGNAWEHAQQKHLAYYLQFAERAQAQLTTSLQVEWTKRLDAEQDNLRAAMQFALDSAQLESGLRLANALWRYWNTRGHFYQGKRWFDAFLAHDVQHVSAFVRAQALFSIGALSYRLGELERAQQLGEAALDAQRALGNTAGMVLTLNLLGIVTSDRGEYARAEACHHEALTLRRAANDQWGITASLNNLGLCARAQGKFARARAYYAESLELKRALSSQPDIAIGLNNLGEIELLSGNYARAASLVQESMVLCKTLGDELTLAIALLNLSVAERALGNESAARALNVELLELTRRIGDVQDEAMALVNLADLARDENDLAHAATQYERAVSLLRRAQDRRIISYALNGLGVVRRMQGDLLTAAQQHHEALDIYQRAQNRLGIAETLEGLAGVALAWNEPTRALEWLGAAHALRDEMETPAYPFDQNILAEIETRARNTLGEGAAAEALQRGRAQTLETILAAVDAWYARVTQIEIANTPRELELFAFGETHVFRNGELLSSKAWRYAKAREIVFYLLARDAVTKEQLALDLYPDASPEQLRSTLHRVLHHARSALGKSDWILFQDEQYRFHRGLSYAYDVERFAQALAEANARKNGDAYLDALQRAVNLYNGDFLPDVESEWAVTERATRREQFLDAATKLGQGFYDAARYADAGAVYEKILAHDNWNEDAHRARMQCFAKAGDVPRALRQYETLRQILRDEFQTEPSRETKLLYEKLKRGESM